MAFQMWRLRSKHATQIACRLTIASRQAIAAAVGCAKVTSECMFQTPSLLVLPLVECVWKLSSGGLLAYSMVWRRQQWSR